VKTSGASGEVCPVRCDFRRESDILDMFQLIRSKYHRLDVCINNAGQVVINSLSEETTEEWRDMLEVRAFQRKPTLVYSTVQFSLLQFTQSHFFNFVIIEVKICCQLIG